MYKCHSIVIFKKIMQRNVSNKRSVYNKDGRCIMEEVPIIKKCLL